MRKQKFIRTISLGLLISFTVLLSGCKKNKIDDYTIIVGASVSPHAEILEQARSYIVSKGYKLEIKVYDDYILPNIALDEGELDANFFQHQPYLNKFNKEKKTDLVSVLSVHYEPLGLYAGKSNSLTNIRNRAQIIVPNDSTNYARALLLLESLNLITLSNENKLEATEHDIISNPYQLEIIPMEAASIVSQLVEVDYAVINGNYVQSSGLDKNKRLGVEDAKSVSAINYANIVVVKKGNENQAAIKVLVEALQQPNIKAYIENTYHETVLPLA